MARLHQARLPAGGACFLDRRGSDRALVVRWDVEQTHDDGPATDVVVLALWRGAECVGTFRLGREDAASLVATLGSGLGVDQAPAPSATR